MIASTLLPERSEAPLHADDAPPAPAGPDLSLLEDKVPGWAKLSRGTTVLTLLTGLLFLALSYQPLWHTDLWGHLSYGRWIVQHHALPATEPLLPLCEGVPFNDTAWLSKVIGYETERAFGVSGLQFLYAASIIACVVMLVSLVVRRTGSVFWASAAAATFVAVEYQHLIIVRPQLAGLVGFTATLAVLTAQKWRRGDWLLLPATFALWANLHGSFPMGLLLIGCFVAGGGIDVFRRTRSVRGALLAPTVRRRALLLELCAVAVLLNPLGLSIYYEVFKVAGNLNLRDLIEWEPLTLRMMQGKVVAAVLLGLFALLRFSPRRLTAAEVIALTAFGLGMCWSSRVIVWWGPLAACAIGLHGAAASRGLRHRFAAPSPRSGLWTVATLGLAWISFAYTPFGLRLLHGGPDTPQAAFRQFRRSVSSQTPIDAAGYLNEHPPQGLVFNTYEWGDYLLWAGPAGMELFLDSHAHLIPRDVWQDSQRISMVAEGWQDKLDRYGVNAIVVDHAGRGELIRQVAKFPEVWEPVFDDGLAVVFVRKNPI